MIDFVFWAQFFKVVRFAIDGWFLHKYWMNMIDVRLSLLAN